MKSVDRLVMDEIKEFVQGSGIQKARLLVSKRFSLRLLAIMQTTDCHLMDRITKRTFSHRRKELVELLENEDDFNHLAEDVSYALDLGRKAPSAANPLPFMNHRYSLYDNAWLTVFSPSCSSD